MGACSPADLAGVCNKALADLVLAGRGVFPNANQLCPDVQALLLQTALIREANAQHAADLCQGMTLSMYDLATQSLAKVDKFFVDGLGVLVNSLALFCKQFFVE